MEALKVFFILIAIDHDVEITEILVKCDLQWAITYIFVIIRVHNSEHSATQKREDFHS